MGGARSLQAQVGAKVLFVLAGLFSPSAASAHGGEIVYVFGAWFLLLLVGLILLLACRIPWRLKLTVFGALVLSIISMLFLPLLPSFALDLLPSSSVGIVLVSAGLPVLAAVGAYFGLRRRLGERN
jgi:hypothetical protein